MKKACKKWRHENNVTPEPSRVSSAAARNQGRQSTPIEAEYSDDDNDEADNLAATGLDLVGKKFHLATMMENNSEEECLVTEPGIHLDEDTGEEYDMLWYEFIDPDTEEKTSECSLVSEVREWVSLYDATI